MHPCTRHDRSRSRPGTALGVALGLIGIALAVSFGHAQSSTSRDDSTPSLDAVSPGLARIGVRWPAGPFLATPPAVGGAVDLAGDIAVVGAPGARGGGAAYVFTRAAGTWTASATLVAADRAAASFGHSVALFGNTIVVGAPLSDVDGRLRQGAAYVFTQIGGAWIQTAKLTASDGGTQDHFGHAVDVNVDPTGVTLFVAVSSAASTVVTPGAVYVFAGGAGSWTETSRLAPDEVDAGDGFGRALTLAEDGTLLVGAPQAGLTRRGATYGYEWFPGPLWYLVTLSTSESERTPAFGSSVAALDREEMVIGAATSDVGGNPTQGAVHRVYREGGIWWMRGGTLTASDGATGDLFGQSVSLTGNPTRIVVGAPQAAVGGNAFQGAAYVYQPGAPWVAVEVAKLTAAAGGPADQFGTSVAISGNSALVGAPFAEVDGRRQGAAYVFTEVDGVWTETATLTRRR